MERNAWKGWRTTVCLMLVSCVVALTASADERKVFSVADFGVKAGVEHVQTKEIQALINHVSAEGGGIVRFAAGEYVTGCIELKSGVTLHLSGGRFCWAVPTPMIIGRNIYLENLPRPTHTTIRPWHWWWPTGRTTLASQGKAR